MSTVSYYTILEQQTDHDLSLETEQEEQSNKAEHGLDRTSSSSTDESNRPDGQSDSSTGNNTNPTTTTNSGTMLSLEMDVGEPLVVETPTNRCRPTLFGKKKTSLVGCAAILIGIVVLSIIMMKFSRHKPTTNYLHKKLIRLVQSRLSSISFDSPTSPESKALDWMVNVDEFDHTTVSDDRLVQRFAVVAMVYGMRFEGQGHMPNAKPVCMWEYKDYVTFLCDGMTDVLHEIEIFGDWSENTFLPVSIGLLTSLKVMYLYDNNLVGTIPSEIGLLTSLTRLEATRSGLIGTIPTEIGLLTRLTGLILYGNKFTGTIPTEVGTMTRLKNVGVSNNKLTGTIPTEIWKLANLYSLVLFDNELSGSIPASTCPARGHVSIDCDKITCSCCTNEDGGSCRKN